MTVEIRELVIRAVVTEPRREGQTSAGTARPPYPEAQDQQVLVEECVKQVLRILEKNRER